MIDRLKIDLLVRLPSGNVVRLLAPMKNKEWLCEYTEQARARGEVIFSSPFLRDYGVRV